MRSESSLSARRGHVKKCRAARAGQEAPPSSERTGASKTNGTFNRIAAGGDHACAVRSDGSLSCWGADANGQSSPPGGTFSQVTAGGEHSCAIKSGGTQACWGEDLYGQSTPPPLD